MTIRHYKPLLLVWVCLLASACGSPSGGFSGNHPEILDSLSPEAPTVVRASPVQTHVLILSGAGTRASDVSAIEDLLDESFLSYSVAEISQLGRIEATELAKFGVILWPSGQTQSQARELSEAARALLKNAVIRDGVAFLGWGTGAWAAGSEGAGLGLLSDRLLPYSPFQNSHDVTQVQLRFRDGSVRTLSYRDGPALGPWGSAIAQYRDGSVAIAEGIAGHGHLLLSGPDPLGKVATRSDRKMPSRANRDIVLRWIQSLLR